MEGIYVYPPEIKFQLYFGYLKNLYLEDSDVNRKKIVPCDPNLHVTKITVVKIAITVVYMP